MAATGGASPNPTVNTPDPTSHGGSEAKRYEFPPGISFARNFHFKQSEVYFSIFDGCAGYDSIFQEKYFNQVNLNYDGSLWMYRQILEFEQMKVDANFYEMSFDDQDEVLKPFWDSCQEQYDQLLFAMCDPVETQKAREFRSPKVSTPKVPQGFRVFDKHMYMKLAANLGDLPELAHRLLFTELQEGYTADGNRSKAVNRDHWSSGQWGNRDELEEFFKEIFRGTDSERKIDVRRRHPNGQLYLNRDGLCEYYFPPYKDAGRGDRCDAVESLIGLSGIVAYAAFLEGRDDAPLWRMAFLRCLPMLWRYFYTDPKTGLTSTRKVNIDQGDSGTFPSRSCFFAWCVGGLKRGVAEYLFAKEVPVITVDCSQISYDTQYNPSESMSHNLLSVYEYFMNLFPMLRSCKCFTNTIDLIQRAHEINLNPENFVTGCLFSKLRLTELTSTNELQIIPFYLSEFTDRFAGVWRFALHNENENAEQNSFYLAVEEAHLNLVQLGVQVIPHHLKIAMVNQRNHYLKACNSAQSKLMKHPDNKIIFNEGKEGWFFSEESIASVKWPNTDGLADQYDRAYGSVGAKGKLRYDPESGELVPHVVTERNAKGKGKHQTGIARLAALQPEADRAVEVTNAASEDAFRGLNFVGGKKGAFEPPPGQWALPINERTTPVGKGKGAYSKGTWYDTSLKGVYAHTQGLQQLTTAPLFEQEFHVDPNDPDASDVIDPYYINEPEVKFPQATLEEFRRADGHARFRTTLYQLEMAPAPDVIPAVKQGFAALPRFSDTPKGDKGKAAYWGLDFYGRKGKGPGQGWKGKDAPKDKGKGKSKYGQPYVVYQQHYK